MKRNGFAQIPLMIGLLIMAVAVPIATKLVQQNQDTRNQAATCGGTYQLCCNNTTCSSTNDVCTAQTGGKWCIPKTIAPTSTPKPINPTATPAYRNCTIKTCGSGVCNSKTESVASNLACPPSNCTSNSNCVTPTAKPTVKPTAVPTVGGICPSAANGSSLECSRQPVGYVCAGVGGQTTACTITKNGGGGCFCEAVPIPSGTQMCPSASDGSSLECSKQPVGHMCAGVGGPNTACTITKNGGGGCFCEAVPIPSGTEMCPSAGNGSSVECSNQPVGYVCATVGGSPAYCAKTQNGGGGCFCSSTASPTVKPTAVPTVGAYKACTGPSNTVANCSPGNICMAMTGGYFCVPINPTGSCINGVTKCQKEGLSSYEYVCNSSGYYVKTRTCDGDCDGNVCASFTKCTAGQTRCNSTTSSFETCSAIGNWGGTYCPNGCNSSGCIVIAPTVSQYQRCSGPSNTQSNCPAGNVCMAMTGGYFCVPKNPVGGCTSGSIKCENEGLSSFEYVCNSSGYYDKTRRCDGACNTAKTACLSFTRCTIGEKRCNSASSSFETCVSIGGTPIWEGSYCPNGCNSVGCVITPVTTTKPIVTTNPTTTINPTVAPTTVVCKVKTGIYTLNDFSIWRSEFIEGNLGSVNRNTWNADFDCDGKVALNDFSMWRTNFINSLIHN